MKKNTLSERLKKVRMEKGVTQKVFAEALNVSSSAVSKWENGQNEPDIETLLKIANYYGISIKELIEGSPGRMPDGQMKQDNTEEGAGSEKDAEKKQYGAVVALVCAATMFLATAGIAGWNWLNSIFSYEIVAERYGEDVNWGETYEISVCYSGDIWTGGFDEIQADIMERWERQDLCSMEIEVIKVVCNKDKKMSEDFREDDHSFIVFLFPYEMPHQ